VQNCAGEVQDMLVQVEAAAATRPFLAGILIEACPGRASVNTGRSPRSRCNAPIRLIARSYTRRVMMYNGFRHTLGLWAQQETPVTLWAAAQATDDLLQLSTPVCASRLRFRACRAARLLYSGRCAGVARPNSPEHLPEVIRSDLQCQRRCAYRT
jgi:hypothetical protein